MPFCALFERVSLNLTFPLRRLPWPPRAQRNEFLLPLDVKDCLGQSFDFQNQRQLI